MERLIRLHLGCGRVENTRKYWPGWINYDSEVDIAALPYHENTVDEIAAIHLFEHLGRWDVDKYVQHWHTILKPGGKLVLEMPSMDKIARLIGSGENNMRLTLLGIFGDARDNDPLMLHQWCYTNAEIDELLSRCGFEVLFKDPHYHIETRDMRIEAIKHG